MGAGIGGVDAAARSRPAPFFFSSSLAFLPPSPAAMDLSATTASSSDLRAIRSGIDHERCASRSPAPGDRSGGLVGGTGERRSTPATFFFHPPAESGRPRRLPARASLAAAGRLEGHRTRDRAGDAPPWQANCIAHVSDGRQGGRAAIHPPARRPAGPPKKASGRLWRARARARTRLKKTQTLSTPPHTAARPASTRARSLAADRRPHRRRDGADGGELRVDVVRPIWLDVGGGER